MDLFLDKESLTSLALKFFVSYVRAESRGAVKVTYLNE